MIDVFEVLKLQTLMRPFGFSRVPQAMTQVDLTVCA